MFILPLIFVLAALSFFSPTGESALADSRRKIGSQILFGIFILILGVSGIFSSSENRLNGGWLGKLLNSPLQKLFGIWVTEIVFLALLVIGGLIIFHFLSSFNIFGKKEEETKFIKEPKKNSFEKENKPSFIKKIFEPKFKVKEIYSEPQPVAEEKPQPQKENLMPVLEIGNKSGHTPIKNKDYPLPPLDLLEPEHGAPTAGDIRVNSAIIKKTLQNFDIPVEMGEVNIGPTVTQYTLKPAEGIKLSRITTLSNDLSLALSAPSIRIEAPIPGRPLVGIEVPNKTRASVRLKNMLEHANFQNSLSRLTLALGRDVSGNPVFADLARMPHMLVAGSTGSGKTICLNTLILSLLYRNGPEDLRFIMVDPKRVEFALYNDLPHLLTPVIHDAQRAVNALKWLVMEMERRFDVLSKAKARDIGIYNEKLQQEKANRKEGEAVDPETEMEMEMESLPYIVLIIDELADLMAARGREIEAGIVRLAQMARAVGIHIIVATQRPSVEVITGLIKANITSRVTFQVASQVDSRTVLDMAGAEKLLGLGDMLFISAEISKPKRIQGAYVSDKELRKVVKFITSHQVKAPETQAETTLEDELSKSVSETMSKEETFDPWSADEDPLFEEAKRVVIESKKASASLLQRRLRVGYARAARLIDILENKGVVGPGEGAKPREVYSDIPGEEGGDDNIS